MKKPKTYQQVIGETIEHMRLKKDWTQEDLAKAVNQKARNGAEHGGGIESLQFFHLNVLRRFIPL